MKLTSLTNMNDKIETKKFFKIINKNLILLLKEIFEIHLCSLQTKYSTMNQLNLKKQQNCINYKSFLKKFKIRNKNDHIYQ